LVPVAVLAKLVIPGILSWPSCAADIRPVAPTSCEVAAIVPFFLVSAHANVEKAHADFIIEWGTTYACYFIFEMAPEQAQAAPIAIAIEGGFGGVDINGQADLPEDAWPCRATALRPTDSNQ
jgi:hypothetical protein